MGFFSKFSRSSSKGKHRDKHHGGDYYKREKSGILGGILGSILKSHSHSHSNSHSHHRRRHKSSWS